LKLKAATTNALALSNPNIEISRD
jgi:hypothetical protein